MIKFDSIEPPQPRIAPMIAPGLNAYDPVNNGTRKPTNDRWREVPEIKRPQTRL
ncbi:MAG TPA: hypothetical protein VFD06_00390 [Candidatus Polarisedimenticolia bacterium]|nr:hypothetical protein [Candidatus Polarisedimenticolia bacterium]